MAEPGGCSIISRGQFVRTMQLRLLIIGGVNAVIALAILLARVNSPTLAARAPTWVVGGYLAVSVAVFVLGLILV